MKIWIGYVNVRASAEWTLTTLAFFVNRFFIILFSFDFLLFYNVLIFPLVDTNKCMLGLLDKSLVKTRNYIERENLFEVVMVSPRKTQNATKHKGLLCVFGTMKMS